MLRDRFNRLALLALSFLAVLAEISYTAAQESPPPNIVFILADDLGIGDLGCYGQQLIQTPRIDRLAREGIRFTNFYAGSTVCAPSRAALMTGEHTGHTRIRGNKDVPLEPQDITVAEVLQSAGYRTGLVGKWGLGNEGTPGMPTRQGFDEFIGFLDQTHAHTYFPDHLWRNETRVPLRNVEEEPNVASVRLDYVQDIFTGEALSFVRRHHAQPFFLFLAYTIPHANNERGRATGDGMEILDYAPYQTRDWPEPQKAHAAMITRLDTDVGRLLDLLDELDIARNTLVIFTSDNGPHREGGADPDFFDSNGPHRGIKRDLYEGGIRVPGIVRWPGRIAPGTTSDHLVAFWDFLPTAADLAGVPIPPDIDGISFAPTLTGTGEQRPHEHLYWEFHERDFLQAIRKGPWKTIKSKSNGTTELYNLETDPSESTNLAANHPEILGQFLPLFQSLRTPSADWPVEAD